MARSNRPPRWFGLIFVGFSLLFIGVGIGLAGQQRERLTTFLPSPAYVQAHDMRVETSTDSDGHTSTSYLPLITYIYEVNGHQYTNTAVTPLEIAGSRSAANDLLKAYPIDTNTTAYYDPNNPRDAYLHQDKDIFPYIFVIFPTLFTSIGMSLFLGLDGWVSKRGVLSANAVLWGGIGGWSMWHYSVTPGPGGIGMTIIGVIIATVVAILAACALKPAKHAT